MNIRSIKFLYYKLPRVIRLLSIIILTMLLFGFLMHQLEPLQFPTVFDGIWWAFVTGATIGYGDYIPLTPAGRILAIMLILTGGGLIAFYITAFAASATKHQQDKESGRLPFRDSGHAILIGWNEKTKQLAAQIIEKHPAMQIVLIEKSARHFPTDDLPVHFIHGDATEDDTLHKANVSSAAKVLITADITKNERQADNYTILSTIAVRGNNPDVLIVAEILSGVQVENALRAGATTIIRSNDFMSGLFFHELSHLKTATPFDDIIAMMNQQVFSHIILPEDMENRTFKEISSWMHGKGHLLLGFIRKGKYHYNPASEHILSEQDILISLVSW